MIKIVAVMEPPYTASALGRQLTEHNNIVCWFYQTPEEAVLNMMYGQIPDAAILDLDAERSDELVGWIQEHFKGTRICGFTRKTLDCGMKPGTRIIANANLEIKNYHTLVEYLD